MVVVLVSGDGLSVVSASGPRVSQGPVVADFTAWIPLPKAVLISSRGPFSSKTKWPLSSQTSFASGMSLR